ncbi:hypothetical protein F2Q69_00035576 [Brassica cretica]|uniref:DUF629 domain-containing protein n=1 Tax=Brassica cretica TaxID=69181 RepID=A0A8S9SCA4_BRACR|nr:hypothetical protein F2Q69_00035576 [Brassica cretica]
MHDYLAASHYDKVIQFTVDELRNLPSGSQLLNRGLGQSPTCIRFLEATPLSKILRFLQHLSATFGLSRYSGIQEKYMGSALNNGAISSSGEIANGSWKREEASAEFTHESYESLLRRPSEETLTLNDNQFEYEESYACTGSQLRDLESGEADERGMSAEITFLIVKPYD